MRSVCAQGACGRNWWRASLATVVCVLGTGSSRAEMLLDTFVPPTANPFLADPANVPDPMNDALDGTVPPFVDVSDCKEIKIKAYGAASNDPSVTIQWGPDGQYVAAQAVSGPLGGISNYDVPMSSLIGVFLGDPPHGPAPAPLPYDTTSLTFAPALGQVFFAGDGLVGFNINQGDCQIWTVPAGAKRLYLAVADSNGWSNNLGDLMVGGIDVEVHCIPVPEPGTIVLAGLGGIALLGWARRNRR